MKRIYLTIFIVMYCISNTSFAITNIDLSTYSSNDNTTEQSGNAKVLQILSSEYQMSQVQENTGVQTNISNIGKDEILSDSYVLQQIKQKRSQSNNIIGLCIMLFLGLVMVGFTISKKKQNE